MAENQLFISFKLFIYIKEIKANIKKKMSKYVNIKTKAIYDNRLEAKLKEGTSNFNKLFKSGGIIFITSELKEFINSIEVD